MGILDNMTDADWIRAYNGKGIATNGNMFIGGYIQSNNIINTTYEYQSNRGSVDWRFGAATGTSDENFFGFYDAKTGKIPLALDGNFGADFSHTVTACSVRTKHKISIGHTFADSPEHAADKSSGNFGLFGMRFLIDRNEHRVELTPAVGKLARQVAFYAIIRTNETLCKTLLCMLPPNS